MIRTKKPRPAARSRSQRAADDALKTLLGLRLRGEVFSTIEKASAVAGVLTFVAVLLKFEDSPVWASIAVLYLCGVTTVALALTFVSERRNRRRATYASALEYVHRAHHALRDAEAAILQRDADIQDTLPRLREVVTNVASAFTIITGQRVRVCIKEVHFPKGVAVPVLNAETVRELRVSTMIRDDATGERASDGDQAFVDQNTDFELIFLDREKYKWFRSNDLESYAASHPYKNSSWITGKEKEYLATGVWPIQKADESNKACHDVLGFLCIDSMSVGIIHDHYDFHLGASIADALYPLLKLLHMQQDAARQVAKPARKKPAKTGRAAKNPARRATRS